MFILGLIIGLVLGFVGGILVGRKNQKGVENAVNSAKNLRNGS